MQPVNATAQQLADKLRSIAQQSGALAEKHPIPAPTAAPVITQGGTSAPAQGGKD